MLFNAKSANVRYIMARSYIWRCWVGVLDTTLCDKVCQLLATGQW